MKLTSEHIKEVAIKQFALHGYEGASLALIANEVGIKKPSIYAHFKNKEELFTQALLEAAKQEIAFTQEFVKETIDMPLKGILYRYITEYLERCEQNNNTKFFIRNAFFPPMQFEELVKNTTNMYLNELEGVISSLFSEKNQFLKENISPNKAALAFLTIIDGLLVELLYGTPERLQKRTVQSWSVYWQGISNEEDEKGEI